MHLQIYLCKNTFIVHKNSWDGRDVQRLKPNFDHLLNEYRKLWNNRKLTGDDEAELLLKEAIARELKDENSHPRVRKPLYEKFFLAVKRITSSSLDDVDKNALIELHIEQLESMK